MKRKLIIIFTTLLFQSSAFAGWGLKDLDPCNKNSGIGRCIRATKPLTICGKSLEIPAISYTACQASAYILPESCNPAVITITEGSACMATVTLMATTCAVSADTMRTVAQSCIANY